MAGDLILCTWEGGKFAPRGNVHTARAHDLFGEGEIVTLEISHVRSTKSHNHQFASIAEAWANLPERLANMPYAKNPESLRKHALIACGFADVETIDAGSKAAAERVAAYVGGLATRAHGYCVVQVNGPVVRCWTPRTQSYRAMGAAEFQRSKQATLSWIEGLIFEGERQRA